MGLEAVVEGNFVRLFQENKNEGGEADLDILSLEQACSFLFGLVLVYGELEADEGVLHSIRLPIPLVGSLVGLQEQLEKILVLLEKEGVFFQMRTQTTQLGQLLELTIQDRELLQQFTYWLAPVYGEITVSRVQAKEKLQASLFSFVEEQQGSHELLPQIQDSVLKMLRK